MYTDTHAHLTSSQVIDQLDPILSRAQHNQISTIVNICTDEATLREGIALRKRHPWIYNAAATTPHDVEQEGESFFPIVKQAAKSGDLIAIGETGLDYYYEHSNREAQQKYLIRYYGLAQETGLPLIFHCRAAFADLLALSDHHYPGGPALLHCFTGTIDEAKGVLDRGWYISISGIVTFKKSEELREVVAYVPLDRLVVETDTPYLAPRSKRGQLNEPAYMVETVEFIAQLLGKSAEEIGKITSGNAERFFSFSKLN